MSSRFFGIGMPKIEFDDLGPEEVTTLPPPDSITLSLSQPGTMPFKPIVEVGDKVQAGQFVALQPNHTGVHSSITGVVSFIGPGFSREGEEVLTMNIRAEGEDKLVPPVEVKRLKEMTREKLIEILADLGFQSPWKPESLKDQLMEYERLPVKTVVVLAVDGEPPIAVQRRFLTEFARDLSDSIVGLRYLTEDARIVVAVPENMAAKAKEVIREKVDIHPVKNSMVETNRTLLVHKITGEFFTARTNINPREKGILVMTAEDLAFISRCLRMGKSRTNKLVTVSAPGKKPQTVRVRLGTPVGHVLKCLDIPVQTGDRVVFGGPLMGIAQPNLSAPVSWGTNGVTVIPSSEVVPFTDAACINCGRCTAVCPVNIQVNIVGRFSEFGFFEKAVKMGSISCVECGLCAYVCPTRRPLLQYMRFANDQYIKQLKEQMAESVGA